MKGRQGRALLDRFGSAVQADRLALKSQCLGLWHNGIRESVLLDVRIRLTADIQRCRAAAGLALFGLTRNGLCHSKAVGARKTEYRTLKPE